MYAYTEQKYDELNNIYYVFITDTKPIDKYDICSKIPDEFFGKLENYSLIISSKEGETINREDIVIYNSNFSPYIEEYENDIIVYILNNLTKEYFEKLSKKSIYYYYSFYFKDMEITKKGEFYEFLENRNFTTSPTMFNQVKDSMYQITDPIFQQYNKYNFNN